MRSKKLNRSGYVYSVSHCESILGYKFIDDIYDDNSNMVSIWHPRSGKKVDCDRRLIEKYFGTGVLVKFRHSATYYHPTRVIWHIVCDGYGYSWYTIYGDFISDIPTGGDLFLEEELFSI